MSLVPYISESDEIILNIRPTLSRILGFVNDPNPVLEEAGVISQIPEIQVREMESVLRLNNGQVAVLGGLMQDSVSKNRDGVPFLSGLPIIGNLFKYRDDQINKTELVIFLRAVVIKEPNLSGDLRNFKPFLPGDRPERTSNF
jgi:general secretion pathway protein D